MKAHKEFQFASVITVIMSLVLILMTVLFLTGAGDRPISITGLSIFVGSTLIVFLLFYGMTTTIDPEKITIAFGVGLIRKRIALDKVKEVTMIKNPWYYGWGIRFIPNGKLYNISGFKGVELTFYSTDRIIWIGTKDPTHLKSEIERFIKK